jgi:hypothetical protein
VTSEDEENVAEDHNQSLVSYDDRILPAVINRMRGSRHNPVFDANEVADNEFFDSGEKVEKKELPAEPEDISAADEANSSTLL